VAFFLRNRSSSKSQGKDMKAKSPGEIVVPPIPPAMVPDPVSTAKTQALSVADEPGVGEITSLIGDGPRQYLSVYEDIQSFDAFRARIHEEIRPSDPVEQIWTDDIVDIEWSIHRLRNIRKSIVENRMSNKISMMIIKMLKYSEHTVPAVIYDKWRIVAQKYVRGDSEAASQLSEVLGAAALEHQMDDAFLGASDSFQAIGNSILAAGRQRDAVLTRLYGRREAIAAGRIPGPVKK